MQPVVVGVAIRQDTNAITVKVDPAEPVKFSLQRRIFVKRDTTFASRTLQIGDVHIERPTKSRHTLACFPRNHVPDGRLVIDFYGAFKLTKLIETSGEVMIGIRKIAVGGKRAACNKFRSRF